MLEYRKMSEEENTKYFLTINEKLLYAVVNKSGDFVKIHPGNIIGFDWDNQLLIVAPTANDCFWKGAKKLYTYNVDKYDFIYEVRTEDGYELVALNVTEIF